MCENMKERGRLWTNAETRAVQEIWNQDSIQRQLSGAVHNDIVFIKIVEELGQQGFCRTMQQCRVKLKALMKKYKEIVDRAQRSGAPNMVGFTTMYTTIHRKLWEVTWI